MKQLVTILFLVLGSASSFAGVYELRFHRVAASNDKATCQTFIEAAAKEFGVQSKAPIIEYGCYTDHVALPNWDGVITYRASAPIALTSTYSGSVYSTAFYNSKEACMAQLSQQKETFAKATQLEPLVAYCMPGLRTFRQHWETRVDGLGAAALKPGVAAVSTWGTVVEEKKTMGQFERIAQDYGIIVAEVGKDVTGIGKSISVRYYASEPYRLDDYYEMNYADTNSCLNAAARVEESFPSSSKSVAVFCENNRFHRATTLHVAAFAKVLGYNEVFRAKPLSNEFTNLNDCQESAAILASKSTDILAAVCAGYGSKYRIHLFSRP